jgi:O-antigen ligase
VFSIPHLIGSSISSVVLLAILPLPMAGLASRGLMLFSLLFAFAYFSYRKDLILGVMPVVMSILGYIMFCGVGSYLALDPTAAYADLLRQIAIIIWMLTSAVALSSANVRAGFAAGCAIVVFVGSCIIIFGYFLLGGGFGGEGQVDFKYLFFEVYGINPNPLSFVIACAYIISSQIFVRAGTFVRLANALVAWSAIYISGSRATMICFIFSYILFHLYNRIGGARLLLSLFGLLLIGVLGVAYYISARGYVDAYLQGMIISDGRIGLWLTGLLQFMESPYFGLGAESWLGQIWRFQFLMFDAEVGLYDGLVGGGYHNSYITHLAERGIFATVMLIYCYSWILYRIFRAYFFNSNGNLGAGKAIALKAICIVFVMLGLRGFLENGGILGYANSSVDFIAYALLAYALGLLQDARRDGTGIAVLGKSSLV